MTDLHLVRPWALMGLALLPMFWFWLSQRQNGVSSTLVPKHLQSVMLSSPGESKNKPWWLMLALAFGFIALSGPSWDKVDVPLFQLNRGQVLVVDLSRSMWATDVAPSRITQARFRAIDLINQIDEGELGLVAYSGDAFVLAPLTEDRNTLLNLIPSLSPELMPVQGSNLSSALTQADQLLKDAGYQQGNILLLTDGLMPNQADDVIELVKQQPWTLKILAFGSADGAPMKALNGELVKDLDGDIALAKTDFSLLQRLAQTSGGRAIAYRPDGSDIDQLLSDDLALNDELKGSEEEQTQSQWQDRGGQLLCLALLPFALALRRLGIMLVVVSLTLPPAPVMAAWWQNSEQQGKALFDSENYTEAATTFNDPMWQGAAHYRAGDYQQALSAFEQADGIEALYNQGNSLAKLNKLDQAAEKYREVLSQQPDHKGAAQNLELVEQAKQNSKQQQPSQNGNTNENQSGDSQSPEGQPDRSDSDDDTQQQNQSNQQQESGSQSESESQQNSANSDSNNQQEQQNSAKQPEAENLEQSEPKQGQSGEEANKQQSALAKNAEPTEPEQPNEKQLWQRRLQQVPDDPALLLRNKMQLEYQRRRQNGELTREQTQW